MSKRRYPRFRNRIRVRVDVDGGRSIVAFTGDVGPFGVYVCAPSPCQPRTDVEVVMTLPDGSESRARGTVRWAKRAPLGLSQRAHAGFGVQFSDASECWFQYCLTLASRHEAAIAADAP